MLSELNEPLCKRLMFDVASVSGTVRGVEVSTKKATNISEGVPEKIVTSGGFSTLDGIAQCQADERFWG